MRVFRFTAREKADEVKREVEMRRRVYAAKVARGDWPQSKADMHIAIMEAIEQDYRNAAEAEDLFAPVTVRVPLELDRVQNSALCDLVRWQPGRLTDELWQRVLGIFRKP